MPTISIGVDVGSNGAIVILERGSTEVKVIPLHKKNDVKKLKTHVACTQGSHLLLGIEKVNGSSMMKPSACFSFGANYGYALSQLFDTLTSAHSLGHSCSGVRVFTPAGWQAFFKAKGGDDAFDFSHVKKAKGYKENKEE